MTKLVGTTLGIIILLVSSVVTVYPQSVRHSATLKRDAPVEEFSFLIKDFKVDHQTERNNLNISISYRYVANVANSEYPDFRWLAKDVETLLTNYPNDS